MNARKTKPSGREARWLLARHLEVFVPKPINRSQENALFRVLDQILRSNEVSIKRRPDSFMDSCPSRVKDLLEEHNFWENIIFGYSTYLADGHFLQLSRKTQERDPDTCWREQTLILKFIVTNYRTQVEPTWGRTFSQELRSRPDWRLDADDKRIAELTCAELHYTDTCDHIVEHIAMGVLDREYEVWSQEWLTVLNRWKLRRRRDPIALNKGEKERRACGRKVLFTTDYLAR